MSNSFIRSIRQNVRNSALRLLGAVPQAPRRVFDLWLDLQTAAPTPDVLLQAVLNARFPLTCPETGRIYWKSPDPRGVLPVQNFHVPKKLNRLLRSGKFQISIDRCFHESIRACAERDETWITSQIIDLYSEMHRLGVAHSFEVWENGELVGGRVGMAIGRYFVGVSQFNRVRDAGKIAFLQSAATLAENGFLLHDVQEWTPHLEQFGCIRLPRVVFQQQLLNAVCGPSLFDWTSHQQPVPTQELQQAEEQPIRSPEPWLPLQPVLA